MANEEFLLSLNAGYNWFTSLRDRTLLEQRRDVNITTGLLLRMRGKVLMEHEDRLKREQEAVIAAEESALRQNIQKLHECSDSYFLSQLMDGLRSDLRMNSNDHTIHQSTLPEELHKAISELAEVVDKMADTYVEEKKKKAVQEVEQAVAEMINNVDIEGERKLRNHLADVKRIKFTDELIIEGAETAEEIEFCQLLEEENALTAYLDNQVDIARSIVDEELRQQLEQLFVEATEDLSHTVLRLDKISSESLRTLHQYSDDIVHGHSPRKLSASVTTSVGVRNICKKGREVSECIAVNIEYIKSKFPHVLKKEFDSCLLAYQLAFEAGSDHGSPTLSHCNDPTNYSVHMVHIYRFQKKEHNNV